jgi:hypothetical protein
VSIDKPNPGRQPVDYTPELGSTICDRLDAYETLREICADPMMPDKKTLVSWLAQHADFRDDHAFMRYWQAVDLGGEAIPIIDDVLSRCLERVRGARVVKISGRHALARARLRAEIRSWVADRLLPESPPSWFWTDKRK